MFKIVLLVCAQALLIQSIAGQCIGAGYPGAYGLGIGPFGYDGYGIDSFTGPYGYGIGGFGYDGLAGPYGYGLGPYGCDGYGPGAFAASYGGGLGVTSASPMPASGVSVISENYIEGELAVVGALPFLGTVALEGALPTAGAGAVSYGCGNGAVAMLAEDGAYGYGAGALGYDGFGYGAFGYGAGALAYDGFGYGPYGYGAGALAYDGFGYGPYGRADIIGDGYGCGMGPYRAGFGYGAFY